MKKTELSDPADAETPKWILMEPMYYIGLDVYKLQISYCVKDAIGKIHAEGMDTGYAF